MKKIGGGGKLARRKRRSNDRWIDDAIKIGLGVLALYFLKKLTEGSNVESEKVCAYCGYSAQKWSRACSNCRNSFPL